MSLITSRLSSRAMTANLADGLGVRGHAESHQVAAQISSAKSGMEGRVHGKAYGIAHSVRVHASCN